MSQEKNEQQLDAAAEEILKGLVNGGYDMALTKHCKAITEGFLMGQSTGVMLDSFKKESLANGKCSCGDPAHADINVLVTIEVRKLSEEEFQKERERKEAEGATTSEENLNYATPHVDDLRSIH